MHGRPGRVDVPLRHAGELGLETRRLSLRTNVVRLSSPTKEAEVDQALPSNDVPQYEQVKDLPYLDKVIQETLRIHSTSSQGLPRVVPPGPGVELAGHHFPQGVVLSVPAYTMHHRTLVTPLASKRFLI